MRTGPALLCIKRSRIRETLTLLTCADNSIAQWKCSHYRKELGFCWIFINMTTFPFPCTYLCYNILLTNAPNTIIRIMSVLLTHFRPFAQDWSFIKCFWFWILLVVLENTYLEEMVGNGFSIFLILKKNPFVLKKFHTRFCSWFSSMLQISCVYYSPLILSDFSKLVTFDRGFIQFPLCIV